MLRTVIALLVAVLGLGGLGAAAGDRLDVVIKGWGTFVDADGDCRVTVEAGKLMITVPGTPHDFAAELNRWNAPHVRQEVKGDFVAEVRTSGTFDPSPGSTIKGRKAYNGAGILLVGDKNNHASLQRASFWDGDRVRHYLNFEVRRDGKLAAERFDMDIPDADCWLRLERRDGKLYAMTGKNGVEWRSYEPLEVGVPQDLVVGVVAVNSAPRPFACAFERFALFQRVRAADGGGEPVGRGG